MRHQAKKKPLQFGPETAGGLELPQPAKRAVGKTALLGKQQFLQFKPKQKYAKYFTQESNVCNQPLFLKIDFDNETDSALHGDRLCSCIS
jgi:hypothetical protein